MFVVLSQDTHDVLPSDPYMCLMGGSHDALLLSLEETGLNEVISWIDKTLRHYDGWFRRTRPGVTIPYIGMLPM